MKYRMEAGKMPKVVLPDDVPTRTEKGKKYVWSKECQEFLQVLKAVKDGVPVRVTKKLEILRKTQRGGKVRKTYLHQIPAGMIVAAPALEQVVAGPKKSGAKRTFVKQEKPVAEPDNPGVRLDEAIAALMEVVPEPKKSEKETTGYVAMVYPDDVLAAGLSHWDGYLADNSLFL